MDRVALMNIIKFISISIVMFYLRGILTKKRKKKECNQNKSNLNIVDNDIMQVIRIIGILFLLKQPGLCPKWFV